MTFSGLSSGWNSKPEAFSLPNQRASAKVDVPGIAGMRFLVFMATPFVKVVYWLAVASFSVRTFQTPSAFTARVSACLIKAAREIERLSAMWSTLSSRSGGRAKVIWACLPAILRGCPGAAGGAVATAGAASGAPPMNLAKAASSTGLVVGAAAVLGRRVMFDMVVIYS
jgi:hypothetical protein